MLLPSSMDFVLYLVLFVKALFLFSLLRISSGITTQIRCEVIEGYRHNIKIGK